MFFPLHNPRWDTVVCVRMSAREEMYDIALINAELIFLQQQRSIGHNTYTCMRTCIRACARARWWWKSSSSVYALRMAGLSGLSNKERVAIAGIAYERGFELLYSPTSPPRIVAEFYPER